MKKLAIGCGLVLILVGVAAAVAGYYVFRRVQTTVSQFAELRQLPEIERGVRNREPFTPPDSGELTAGQVERFVRVQTLVRGRLGARMTDFEARYRSLAEKAEASVADVPALLSAYRDMAAVWLDAKRSQVEALNEAGLSLAEYQWIRNQVYRALGTPFLDFDVSQFADEVRHGHGASEAADLRGAVGEPGPALNRKLIERFRKQLEENLPLASFGL